MSVAEPAVKRSTSDVHHLKDIPDPGAAGHTRFLTAFLLTFFVGIAVIAGLNIAVDPFGYFGTGVLPPLVLDDRDQKATALGNLPQQPATLILGSSRSYQLSPALAERFAAGSAFNFAVTGARTEDYLAILRYVLAQPNPRLSRLIIGIEERALMQRGDLNPRLIQSNVLRPYAPRTGGTDINELAGVTLTWDATYSTLLSIRRAILRPDIHRTAFDDAGYIVQTSWDRAIAAGTYDQGAEIRGTIRNYLPDFGQIDGLSSEGIEYFMELLRIARERGVRVDAFIPPMHPAMLEGLRALDVEKRIEETRSLLVELEQQGLLDYHETASAADFGGSADGFYDGVHMNAANGQLLLCKVLSGSAGCAVQ